MKKILTLSFLILMSSTLFADPFVPKKLPPLRLVDDFSQDKTDDFPPDFKTYPFQRGKAEKVYKVQAEGENKFLKGKDSEDISVQAFKRFFWEIDRWPYASWKWRAVTLPKGAAENNPATNDSACGIYVVFGGYTGKVLKYVWSTTLPVGSIVEKKPGQFYFVVLQSGSANVGTWKTEAVNVLEDYKKAFKADPEKDPSGFGFLTDGNATHTPAECDYDDLKISQDPLK